MNKANKKKIRQQVTGVLFKVMYFVCIRSYIEWVYSLGEVLGRLGFLFVKRHRRAALESLSIAFPEKSEEDKRRIARRSIEVMMQSSLETLYMCKKADTILPNVQVQGLEYLKAAAAKGKGVISITAHMGNFLLMGRKLVELGYKVNYIMRPLRDEFMGQAVIDVQHQTYLNTIFSYPRKRCIADTVKALRNGEIVFILADQNFGTGGVWVNFFNKLAATAIGPVVFAQRTQAPIIPMYIEQTGVGKHCVHIEPEFKLEERNEKEETILVNVTEFTKMIEGWIRKNPSQWSWFHRRWKSRPSETVLNEKFKVQSKI